MFGIVVYEDGRVAQPCDRRAELGPVLRADLSGLQVLPVDLGLRGQHALRQLEMAHLEGEEEGGPLHDDAHVGQNPQGKARLAHAGTGADDRQRRGLQAEQDPVELVVAGGHAGDGRTALAQLLDAVQTLQEELVQGGHGVGRPPLGHVEHQLLGLVDGGLDVLGHRVGQIGDLPRHADEAAQQRVLLHDGGVVAGVGDGRGVGLQRDEHRGVPYGVEQPRALELVGDGHRVDRLSPLHEGPYGTEDVAVGRLVEVSGRALLDGHRRRVVGEQHGTEEGLLGLEVVRGDPAVRHRSGTERAGPGVVKGVNHGPPTLRSICCG